MLPTYTVCSLYTYNVIYTSYRSYSYLLQVISNITLITYATCGHLSLDTLTWSHGGNDIGWGLTSGEDGVYTGLPTLVPHQGGGAGHNVDLHDSLAHHEAGRVVGVREEDLFGGYNFSCARICHGW